jgi:hypothetical protein
VNRGWYEFIPLPITVPPSLIDTVLMADAARGPVRVQHHHQ